MSLGYDNYWASLDLPFLPYSENQAIHKGSDRVCEFSMKGQNEASQRKEGEVLRTLHVLREGENYV
jgi:hypothetical protein